MYGNIYIVDFGGVWALFLFNVLYGERIVASRSDTDAEMGMGELLSLFSLFCGGFIFLIAVWWHVSSSPASEVAGLRPFTDRVDMTFSGGSLDESDIEEISELNIAIQRLNAEMDEAREQRDTRRIKDIREELTELMQRQRDIMKQSRESRSDPPESASSSKREVRQESAPPPAMDEETAAKSEMIRLLAIVGGGLMFLGACSFSAIRARS